MIHRRVPAIVACSIALLAVGIIAYNTPKWIQPVMARVDGGTLQAQFRDSAAGTDTTKKATKSEDIDKSAESAASSESRMSVPDISNGAIIAAIVALIIGLIILKTSKR